MQAQEPEPDDAAVRVTAVVVTYNSADVLPGLLEALPGAFGDRGPAELVVADNASRDATLAAAASAAPGATVVEMGRNAGYAAGLNAAVRRAAPSDAILLLNPDARPRAGSVPRMVEALRKPGVCAVVPRLVHPDGRTAPSLRRDPTVLRALGEALLGGRRAGRFAALGEVVRDPAAYEREGPVAWATGAAMLIDRRCLEALDGWEESFFLYSEETEFALRAREAGYRLWYVPDAVVEHIGGEAPTSPELWSLLTLNRVRLFRRRHSRVRSVAFYGAVLLNEAVRAVRGGTHRAALRSLLGRPVVAQLLQERRE